MRSSRLPLPDCVLLLVVVSGAVLVQAQYDGDYGPAPPRLLIPGAVPLGPAPPLPRRLSGGRPRTLQGPPDSAPRPRARPSARRLPSGPQVPVQQPTPVPPFFSPSPALLQQRPLIQQQQPQEPFIPPRPVSEDAEDDFDDEYNSPSLPPFSPTPGPSTPPPPPPPPPRTVAAFRPERPAFRPESRPVLPTSTPEYNYVTPSRQQARPTAVAEEPQQQQYSRQQQAQYNRAQNTVRAPQKQTYVSDKQLDYEKPIRQHQRPRKPVAQVLRKYREDNPDGSITWGFENDDGSYKEETIGTDCVTYGKYGYIDPDGTRREYTYSTGIPCDKNKADSEEQPSEGYVDYAENKYVLPNGDSVDLDKMVKNRARKPVSNQQYRSTNNN